MDSDDSEPFPTRSNKRGKSSFSDDSDSDYGMRVRVTRRRKLRPVNEWRSSDADSDTSNDFVGPKRKRCRPLAMSDSDGSSSDSEIVRKKRGNGRVLSDDSSEFTYSEHDSDGISSDGSAQSVKKKKTKQTKKAAAKVPSDSSSDSDGQSEKCPICLLTFKAQEVGSPESCDHSFCAECIQEWSKNVNTCPVDRQPFNLILIRRNYNTKKVSRQVPVEPKTQEPPEVDAFDEQSTFCEVCSQDDREDRMLLCDACDRGFHMDCLDPPIDDVPAGLWYCRICAPSLVTDLTIFLREVQYVVNDGEESRPAPSSSRSRNTIRLMPRTRQSERLRARILHNRATRQNAEANNETHEDEEEEDDEEEQIRVTVSHNNSNTAAGSSRRQENSNVEIECTYNSNSRKEIVVKAKMSYKEKKRKKTRTRRRRRRRTRSARERPQPSAKKRLAVQLGIRAPCTSHQLLPEYRASTSTANIGLQRSQAGIPALHLFGSADDFLSASDADNEGEGPNLLVRRRQTSERSVLRRLANQKSVLASPVLPSCDVLDSILDSQEKFHSKNSVLTLKNDGSIQVDKNPFNNNNYHINLNQIKNFHCKKAPTNDDAANNTAPSTTTDSINNSGTGNANGTTAIATSVNSVTTSSGTSGNDNVDPIQDFSIRSNCGDDVEDSQKSNGNTPTQSESELDIYSDIETVSTSKPVESKEPSPAPEVVASLCVQSDDEANNSDASLVIDTEKPEEKTPVQEEKEEDVTSTTNVEPSTCNKHSEHKSSDDEDHDSEDGCPNFSIYSAESIKFAKNTDLELLNQEANVGSTNDVVPTESMPMPPEPECPKSPTPEPKKPKKKSDPSMLYSDSDDEVAKVDITKPFGIGDIRSLTEDISEEERSYTPCLDERAPARDGFDGLDTEAISDEEKNDFEETHELKTASDGGDALEINAKECELDFTKPEEYEEGEIVDKLKKLEEAKKAEEAEPPKEKEPPKKPETSPKETPAFKKISKSTKDRNYRDKEKTERSKRSPSKENYNPKRRERKREKRKEIERYNVRSVVAEKPRRMKDKFGRDARRRSQSRTSRSGSRSVSRHRSLSAERPKRRRMRSHSKSKSRRRSVSRSRGRRRSNSRTRKRKRSAVRSKKRRKVKSKTRSAERRLREWERWTPTPSRSKTPVSPSWTPPRVQPQQQQQPVKPRNLTVILTNDANKKKKDKRRAERKRKEAAGDKQQKKKRKDRTPPPSKEVFASGDNILVSVSFNDERERERANLSKRKRDDDVSTKRTRREKEKRNKQGRKRKRILDLSQVKPVAIIDLDRSPFKELTPPNEVIVLSDSDGEIRANNVCDSSQQPDNYQTGPKTPPEPQVKFALNAKPQQLRAITNPLHEPDEPDADIDPQEELEQRLNDTLHKGPNTPPEPPQSPPSSPDAYDPFDPTKSRSPTPDLSTTSNIQTCIAQSTEDNLNDTSDPMDKGSGQETPDISHTPPSSDLQPPDSQASSTMPEPPVERTIGVVINQVVQSQPQVYPKATYSQTQVVTSTPVNSNTANQRINILNNTIITPMVSIPQRIVLPMTTKSSPVKVSPTKPPIKSTPIKPMPNKNPSRWSNNDGNDSNMEIDSPYSPGPSDYEDLFEPPMEIIKPSKSKTNKMSGGNKNTFDILFGSSPLYKPKPIKPSVERKKKSGSMETKMVGVVVDEDTLKILDDVPNSAVEMQVKDKFLKKLNRQERVVEEVKLVLKPHYNKKHINKEEYKDILRRSVPKICHNKTGEINPKKIQNLIEAYVKKVRHSKKVTSSSSVNPQK